MKNLYQRPSERAEEFLTQFLKEQPLPEGARLPSTRFIAKKLGISEGTVRNVLQRWKSDGTLQSRAGSGIFTASPQENLKRFHLGTNAGILAASQFNGYAGKVLLSAFNSVMQLGASASLTSLFSQEEYLKPPTSEEIADRCKGVEAVLVSLSTIHGPALIAQCTREQKPYVVLNAPHENATINFISPDQTTAFWRLGHALKAAGRKRFAILIFPTIERSIAIRQRIAGLVNSLGTSLGHDIDLRIVPCSSWHEEAGSLAMERLFSEGYQADAVLTAGDQLALGAMLAIGKRGLTIPSEVSVISGGGVEQEMALKGISRLELPAEEVGRQAIAMLMEMHDKRSAILPGRYLEIPVIPSGTTTEDENCALSASQPEMLQEA